MVLTVLKEYYDDEYEMLKFLALGDLETFNELAKSSKEYTNHLLGYNVVDRNNNSFNFKIESVKKFLIETNKYKKINLSQEEMWAEISERRNRFEPKIRDIIRKGLRQSLGEIIAKETVINIYGGDRKIKCSAYSYRDIFDTSKVNILFEDLRKIIEKEWDIFKNVFGTDKDFSSDKESFSLLMKTINKYRKDAHANPISEDEMSLFRVYTSKLEKFISDQE
jgi:hypothetical protein